MSYLLTFDPNLLLRSIRKLDELLLVFISKPLTLDQNESNPLSKRLLGRTVQIPK